MRLRWIAYLVVGLVMLIIIMFCSIPVYNIVINKVPPFGLDKQKEVVASYIDFHSFTNPLKTLEENAIPENDPIRDHIMTQDQAWEYAWAFLNTHYGVNLKMWLPIERRSMGLKKISVNNSTPVPAWNFYVMQSQLPLPVHLYVCTGGNVFINAYDGQVVLFLQTC